MQLNRRTILLATPTAMALMACGQATASIPRSQPASVEAAMEQAKGFTVGKADSERHLVVFFDPNCPHCAYFWREMKGLLGVAKFTWIPVSFIKPDGIAKGAYFLGSADPVADMDKHALQFITKKIEPAPTGTYADNRNAVERNGKVLESFGGSQIPYIVAKNLKTGATISEPGGMAKQDLIDKLGWN